MAEDFTLLFLLTLAVGLGAFGLLSVAAYGRIRRFRRVVADLDVRLATIKKNFASAREEMQTLQKDAHGRLDKTEMEHAFTIFSLHVLHRHRPQPVAERSRTRIKMSQTKTG